MLVDAQDSHPILCGICNLLPVSPLLSFAALYSLFFIFNFISALLQNLCCPLVPLTFLQFLPILPYFSLHHPAYPVHDSPQMAISALTSLSDRKLPRVVLEAIVVYFDLTSTHYPSQLYTNTALGA